MARKLKRIDDYLPEILTAHAVRRLTVCDLCGGLGDKNRMIEGWAHPICFKRVHGFASVLSLPAKQSGKFRLKDLTPSELRRLLERLS